MLFPHLAPPTPLGGPGPPEPPKRWPPYIFRLSTRWGKKFKLGQCILIPLTCINFHENRFGSFPVINVFSFPPMRPPKRARGGCR